jgi:hypothetical protein
VAQDGAIDAMCMELPSLIFLAANYFLDEVGLSRSLFRRKYSFAHRGVMADSVTPAHIFFSTGSSQFSFGI